MYLEILHKINFFLAGSIFILEDCCSAEGRESPAGFCSFSLWSQGSPAKPWLPQWHVAEPGCAPIPATAPSSPGGLGVHSGTYSVGDFYFPPEPNHTCYKPRQQCFHKRKTKKKPTKIHAKKKHSRKPYCIEMDAIKTKKVLQKEKQLLLGLYSCTPCFISKLISRCKIFPPAEDQSNIPVAVKSHPPLCPGSAKDRTLYPGACNQKCQRNMQKKVNLAGPWCVSPACVTGSSSFQLRLGNI